MKVGTVAYSVFLMFDVLEAHGLINREEQGCDGAWEIALKYQAEFATSDYNNPNRSEYDCMVDFVKANQKPVWVLHKDAHNFSVEGAEINDEQSFIEAFYPDYHRSAEIDYEACIMQYWNDECDLTDYGDPDPDTDPDAYEIAKAKWLEDRTCITQEELDDWTIHKEWGEARVSILEKSIRECIKYMSNEK